MDTARQVEENSLETQSQGAPVSESWYAIQTRSRHEKTVASQLQEKHIETFLPLIAQVRRWSDRRKTVQFPLFPSYAFVRVDLTAETRLKVVTTPGVVGFVGILGRGLPIPSKQIEDIQTLMNHRIVCSPCPFVRAGQRVRIRGGSLDGVEGYFVRENTDRSLVVSVELIQRSVAMRIEGYEVEPL